MNKHTYSEQQAFIDIIRSNIDVILSFNLKSSSYFYKKKYFNWKLM